MSIIVDKAYDEYIAAVGGRKGSLLLLLYTHMLHATVYGMVSTG